MLKREKDNVLFRNQLVSKNPLLPNENPQILLALGGNMRGQSNEVEYGHVDQYFHWACRLHVVCLLFLMLGTQCERGFRWNSQMWCMKAQQKMIMEHRVANLH